MNLERAFVGATIINGDKTRPIVENGVITVDADGKIGAVGRKNEIPIPKSAQVVEVSGKYIMPGLINAHVHHFSNGMPRKTMSGKSAAIQLWFMRSQLGKLFMKGMYKTNASSFVNAGVTTVRDVGSFFDLDLAMRAKITAGKREGPRILCRGALIIPTGGHGCDMPGSVIVDGVDACIKATREICHQGVDWIKICNTGGVTDARYLGEAGMPHMSVAEIEAVCAEAHRRNIMVASHCESTQGMRDCLAGGVDTIEHAATIEDDMIPLFLHNPKAFRGYVSIVPTLAAAKAIHENEDALTPTPGNRIIIENSRMVAQGSVDALRTALEHGIPVGIGTDASVPFVTPYNTYQELIFFQDYTDLSNADLIDIATKQTAEIINVGKITGTLDEGKSADFMVLSKNPLDSLKNLKRPVAVVSSGVYYDKPTYKEMQGVKN